MIRKIAIATTLLSLSSFAAWDRFPVLDAGKGQAKVGVAHISSTDSDATGYDLAMALQGRYTVAPSIEIAALVPYRLGKEDPTGLYRPVLSMRYWMPTGIGLYADASLPLGNDDVTWNNIGITVGGQLATNLDAAMAVAAEVSYTMEMEKDQIDQGDVLALGGELDYNLGNMTPWVGLDFYMMGEGDYAGFETDSDNAATLSLGSSFTVTPELAVDASVGYGLSGYMEKYLFLEANVAFNF